MEELGIISQKQGYGSIYNGYLQGNGACSGKHGSKLKLSYCIQHWMQPQLAANYKF